MILAAITTCRREPAMVERAVKSVIAQTYRDWNLVVVDDSPADYEFREGVRKMVEGYASQDSRISYVAHDRNYGANHARNTALKIANTTYGGGGHYEFIAYLDDDDEWLPEKLEKQLARFQECDERYGVIYSEHYILNENTGKMIPTSGMPVEGDCFDEIMLRDIVGSMFPLIRVKYLEEAGGFDEELLANQDYDAWVRLAEVCYFAFVDEPLAILHRYDGEHIWSNPSKPLRAAERLILKYKDYYARHPSVLWKKLINLADLYRHNGEYRKFFVTWFKAVKLKPFRIISNTYNFLIAFLPFGIELKFLRAFSFRAPRTFKIVRLCKRFMRGERLH